MKAVGPVHLSNRFVELRPIVREDATAFLEIGREPRIWDYLAPDPFKELSDVERWIEEMPCR